MGMGARGVTTSFSLLKKSGPAPQSLSLLPQAPAERKLSLTCPTRGR